MGTQSSNHTQKFLQSFRGWKSFLGILPNTLSNASFSTCLGGHENQNTLDQSKCLYKVCYINSHFLDILFIWEKIHLGDENI